MQNTHNPRNCAWATFLMIVDKQMLNQWVALLYFQNVANHNFFQFSFFFSAFVKRSWDSLSSSGLECWSWGKVWVPGIYIAYSGG